jgi:membrane protease YdiL (CAAX protease family)
MRKRFVMASSIALLVVLAMAAALAGSLSHGVAWRDATRGVVGVIAVVALFWIVFRTDDIKKPQGLGGPPKPLPPTKEEIAIAYFNVVKAYDGHT